MLSEADVKSQLSYSYIHSLATIQNFACEQVTIDRDSVDLTLVSKGKLTDDSILTSAKLDIQLKATSHGEDDGEFWKFHLSIKNYDDLRAAARHVPAILVILILPGERNQWISHSEDGIMARKCAYWTSLRNYGPTDNENNITIRIPKTNVLSDATLRNLLVKVSKMEELL